MYFDEPAAAYAPAESKLEYGLIGIAALVVSPLGYLAIPLLDASSMAAAHSLF